MDDSLTGNRADRIIYDDLCAPSPDAEIWVTDTGRTLAACKGKFDDPLVVWPGVSLEDIAAERPQTVEEFRRLYFCQWPPEDDGDQDTGL